MAESGKPAVRPDRSQAESHREGDAKTLVAGDPRARETSERESIDDERPDRVAEQLIAYDGLLAGDKPLAVGATPDLTVPETLPAELRSELEPAIECLQLLKALRVQRSRVRVDDNKTTLNLDDRDPAAFALPSSKLPRVFGRFQLKNELGRGGFGVVFLAFDPLLNRDVALKLPRPDCLLTPDLRQRFLREGRAAAGLDHPNIVSVHEAGEIGGICYLATAYCPGVTLSEWLSRRTGPVPVKTAARLVEAIAAGLAHAHERGIVHRDLKPSNVLLQGVESRELRVEGQKEVTAGAPSLNSQLSTLIPKITDFGLAKLADATGDQTRTGIMMGTPRYMAPEQADGRSHAVGPHTDVYALGVILYELLTGTKPFVAASDMEVLRLIATADALAPRRLRREVPLDLETICLKCLEKDPSKRYPNAGELRGDLSRYSKGEPILARPAGSLERLIKWTRRRPAAASLIALFAVALFSFIAAGAWHSHEIAAKNVELGASVQEANEQRELARAGARRAGLNAYAANIRVAGEIYLTRRPEVLADALNGLRPAPGDDDFREFGWFYLWRLARNDQWLRGHNGSIHAIAYSAGGQTLASAADDRTVKIWDASTGQLRASLTGYPTSPRTIAISPNGRWIAVANSDTWNTEPMEVYVWDLHTGELLASLKDSAAIPGALVFSPDSQTLALPRRCVPADRSGAVLLWKPETGQKRLLLDQSNVAMAVAFSPDGKVLAVASESGSQNIRIQLLDVNSGQPIRQFAGQTDRVHGLKFSPDGKTLASYGRQDTVRLWDVTSGVESTDFRQDEFRAPDVAFSADGRTLASLAVGPEGEASTTILVRDVESGERRLKPFGSGYSVYGMALAPGGRTVALGCSDHILRLWKPIPEPAVVSLAGHSKEAWAVAFAADGHTLASASDDHTIKLWDVRNGAERATLEGHESLVSCLAFASRGKTLATGSYDCSVKLWDYESGELKHTLVGHTGALRSVALSPDGTLVASGAKDWSVRLWDLATGACLGELWDHENSVRSVSFSPDGKWLASASEDNTIKIWDVATRSVVRQTRDVDAVWTLAFAPDGKTFATGGASGII